ncbi:carbonic anhydrase [Candidatus Sororendozoicomonas aggregata]|uniref:carbonic anhydrase n=1 Tax=Candidatus Sororendozoicomonas aggregata TaxID=3073239 RepID=UPI002ECFD2EA
MISAKEALERLKAGNQRFASNVVSLDRLSNNDRRQNLVEGQAPFAIILGCSDSRVPAEIVFDQGLGDLFVIRIAGNIVAPSQIGSVEFAVEAFKTQLVVVLGHSKCGAVKATLDALKQTDSNVSENLLSIVRRIQPTVSSVVEAGGDKPPEEVMRLAVRANILASVNQLRHGSEILERLTEKKGLVIVGAEYSLDTGKVTFLPG